MKKIIIPPGTHKNIQRDISSETQAIEYHLESNAQVTLFHEQNVSLIDSYQLAITFYMASGSFLNYFPIMLGAQQSALTITIILENDTQAAVQGAYACNGVQEYTITTIQKHNGPNAHSSVTINGIAHQKSFVQYKGTIAIEKDAARVSASQENKTILYSDAARALSIPSLEVKNNDVQCAHGSAVGPLQPELIYYLQARGISALQAKRILLESFFDQTLAALDDAAYKKYCIEQLVAKAFVSEAQV
jgi:Fe-S cluster assembly scaffold protein SufB